MQDINEVFSDLDKRIDEIKKLKRNVNYWVILKSDFDLSKIERGIILFPEKALARINISLNELNELKDLGISILGEHVAYDDYSQPIVFTPEIQAKADAKRQKYYLNLEMEIDYYIKKLSALKEAQETQNIKSDIEKYTITIGADFEFPTIRTIHPEITQPILNKEQSALLFHYLMKTNIILAYDDTAISKIVSILTGFSENTLRREAFGEIHDIKKEIPHSPKKTAKKLSNLEILKTVLVNLIKEIDEDIK